MHANRGRGDRRGAPRWNPSKRFCLGVATAGYIATYAALFHLTEATHDGLSYIAALLGVVFLLSHVNVTLPRVATQPNFTLQEVSVALALVGGIPAVVLPVLLAIHAHRAWLRSAGRKFPVTNLFPGMVTIILQAWGFYLIGILGQPDKVSTLTILQAIPIVAVSTLLASVIEYYETKKATLGSVPQKPLFSVIVSMYVGRVGAGLLGVCMFAGIEFGLAALLQVAGAVILLTIALVLPVVHLERYRAWSGMQRLLETCQLNEKSVRHALENLHSLAPGHGHVLLVEDPAAGISYRAWARPYRSGVDSDVVPLGLEEAVRRNPEPENGRPFLSHASSSASTIIKPGVALMQSNPAIKVSLFAPQPSTLWSGIPLVLESMLGSVSTIVQSEVEQTTTSTALSLLMANLEDGFVVVDSEDTVLSWNNTMAEYTGLDASAAVGQQLSAVLSSFERAVGSVGQPLLFTKDVDGNPRFLYITTYTDVPLKNGKPSTLHAFHDVSKLVASSETRNQFFAYVAHEFKGPMSALMMQAEALEDQLGPENPDLHDMQVTLEHICRLLSDLSTTTELGVSEVPLKVSTRQITAAELLEFPWMCSAVGPNDRIHIEPDSNFTVHVDVFRARQIITNLVSNALKYSPTDTPISVSYGVDRSIGFGYIRVTDEGIGVPDDSKDALFEAYVRGRNSRHTSGQGLGLSLSKTLAEQMGGTIEYAENHPKGSVFTLWIPLKGGSEPEDQLSRKADAIA